MRASEPNGKRTTSPSAGKSLISVSIAVVNRDRLDAAKALAQSESLLKRAQAVAKIGHWRIDLVKNELTASEEARRIFGVEIDTPLAFESYLGHIHPDDQNWMLETLQQAMTGEDYVVQHRIISRGQILWVESRG